MLICQIQKNKNNLFKNIYFSQIWYNSTQNSRNRQDNIMGTFSKLLEIIGSQLCGAPLIC